MTTLAAALADSSTGFFFGSKKNTPSAPKAPEKTFYEKLDEEIEKKPKKLELYIQKKDNYLAIPSPKIYGLRTNADEKSTVELLNSSNLTSNSIFESEQDKYASFLEKGLEQLYFASKILEITRLKADSLGMSEDQHRSFYSKLAEAKTNLEEATKLNESSAAPIFYEGIFHLFNKERLDPAQKCFKKALEINPKMPWANHFLGSTLSSHSKALKHLNAEMENNPNPYSLQQIAEIDFKEKKYDDALIKFEEVLTLEPKTRLAHLRISEIYRQKGNPEKELKHLNKELENAHYHRDQKLANRISRDLGYYNLRQYNPYEALSLFDYARDHRMSHEKYSTTHLFDRAYALAMIEGPEKAEEDLLKITRKQFIDSGTKGFVAKVYFEPFKSLAEFRIKHFGFDQSRERLEEDIKKNEEISDSKSQPQLELSLKIELASLLYIHAKSIGRNNPEKSKLFEEAKQIISEKSENNPSYQAIRKSLREFLGVSIATKKPEKKPERNPEEKPHASPQKSSHHKVKNSQNKLNERDSI